MWWGRGGFRGTVLHGLYRYVPLWRSLFFQISLHSVNQTLYQSNLRSFECRTDCFVALLILKVQLNLCTTAPLGTERNQPLWRGWNKSECMDCPPKKWLLVEVWLYHGYTYHLKMGWQKAWFHSIPLWQGQLNKIVLGGMITHQIIHENKRVILVLIFLISYILLAEISELQLVKHTSYYHWYHEQTNDDFLHWFKGNKRY